MSEKLRRKLASQRDDALRQAIEKLASDPVADVATDIERFETHDKVLAGMPSSRSKELIGAFVVGIACLLCISLAWSFRMPTTQVRLIVTADSVSLKLAAPWNWPVALPLGSAPIRLENLSAVELPNTQGQIEQLSGDPWVEIAGGNVSLSHLAFGEGGKLLIERDEDGRLNLFAGGAKLTGELAIWGGPTVAAGEAAEQTAFSGALHLPDAEIVAFSAKGEGAVPTRLSFLPQQRAVLANLRVVELGFAQEAADQPGNVIFASTVLGGKLLLADVGGEVDLEEGDRLTLTGVSGLVNKISTDDEMVITFEGSVADVFVGSEDRTPSLMEYMFHNQRLAFFWTAGTFLWGAIWSARKFLIS
jgi:hypothetical protein